MADASAPVFDPAEILAVLAKRQVDYVLIGGVAVQTHGHTRMTNDLDLIPAPARENLVRLADALTDLGARVLNEGEEDRAIDAGMLPQAMNWQFATRHGDVDVMHEVPGGIGYEQLRRRALVVELGGIEVPVSGLDDLIRMKLARGRPLDRADVAALTDSGS